MNSSEALLAEAWRLLVENLVAGSPAATATVTAMPTPGPTATPTPTPTPTSQQPWGNERSATTCLVALCSPFCSPINDAI